VSFRDLSGKAHIQARDVEVLLKLHEIGTDISWRCFDYRGQAHSDIKMPDAKTSAAITVPLGLRISRAAVVSNRAQ
jgi:hypothetical protein